MYITAHCITAEKTQMNRTPGQQLGQRPVKFGKSWGAINVGNMQRERAGVE